MLPAGGSTAFGPWGEKGETTEDWARRIPLKLRYDVYSLVSYATAGWCFQGVGRALGRQGGDKRGLGKPHPPEARYDVYSLVREATICGAECCFEAVGRAVGREAGDDRGVWARRIPLKLRSDVYSLVSAGNVSQGCPHASKGVGRAEGSEVWVGRWTGLAALYSPPAALFCVFLDGHPLFSGLRHAYWCLELYDTR